MKCNNCDHENPKDSLFCEECGYKFVKENKEDKDEEKAIVKRKSNRELDDVLFLPKKSGGSGVWTVLGILFVIGAIGVAFLAWWGSQDTTSDELSNSDYSNTTTSSDVQSQKYFDLSQLQLLNTKMLGNSYGVPNPIFQATLHNSAAVAATNIILRYNFYNSGKADAVPVDTRYMKITDYLGPGDSTSINTIVETNANTAGDFWWRAEVYSAESY
jgi:hypothetical protein